MRDNNVNILFTSCSSGAINKLTSTWDSKNFNAYRSIGLSYNKYMLK